MLSKFRFTLYYLRKPRWDTGVTPPELLEYIQTHTPGKALDLGCGTGTNVLTLARYGWQATGVDFVHSALRRARRKARQANLHAEFFLSDVTRLEFLDDSYDLILDIGCFHNLSAVSKHTYLRNIIRLLAPDGTFLLYAFVQSIPNYVGPGLTTSDLQACQQYFHQDWRKDGFDHQQRQSAWFAFTRR